MARLVFKTCVRPEKGLGWVRFPHTPAMLSVFEFASPRVYESGNPDTPHSALSVSYFGSIVTCRLVASVPSSAVLVLRETLHRVDSGLHIG